jgi:hypothetical protein
LLAFKQTCNSRSFDTHHIQKFNSKRIIFLTLTTLSIQIKIAPVKQDIRFSLLRTIAVVAVSAGAVGSLALMFHAGRNNRSAILMALFFIWVVSPFIGVLLANVFAKRWSVFFRVTLYILMIVLSLGSLVAYRGVLSPAEVKPTAVFLIVPLISWLVIVSVILLAEVMPRKLLSGSDAK